MTTGISRSRAKRLLDEAKSGRLSGAELDEVVRALQGPPEALDADLYTLLHIVGLASDADAHAGLVERFVDHREDPPVAALALKVLCLWWGRTGDRLEEVRAALEGAEWDEDEDARLAACSIAGEYLRDHADPALLRILMATAEDREALPGTREHALYEVGRALGHSHEELLHRKSSGRPVLPGVLGEEAAARLAREEPG
ncbi:hypothetical protein HDA32_004303 [Spinactinospora alkalitolerans]|uniref:HEAT repeat domain-containing protein n=1 Tax=Spinactinospora alkalitolerans TaxID=687207 RepID=A0A852U2M1_9ACTN|nr:hypothetical protein [Spinactinospora alkalitolerans]NYE49183.1 hypothetical protein [Spinactinospora alkalitolerans]